MLTDDATPSRPADAAIPRGTPARDDAPLDPAIERVRVKLARLMAVGIGTLLLGVVAVVAGVLYKAGQEPSTPAGTGEARVPLIAGASLADAALAPNGLLLRIAMPDGSVQLVVLDPATGAPRLRVSVGTDVDTSPN